MRVARHIAVRPTRTAHGPAVYHKHTQIKTNKTLGVGLGGETSLGTREPEGGEGGWRGGVGIISNPADHLFKLQQAAGGLLALPTLAGTASLGGSADWFNSNKVATTGFLPFVAYQFIRHNKREKEG